SPLFPYPTLFRSSGRDLDVYKGPSIREYAVARCAVLEAVVMRRELLRVVKCDRTNLRTDREGDGDLFVERRFKVHLTGRAMIVAMNLFEVAQALDHARTLRAQEQPVHAKEPQRCGV